MNKINYFNVPHNRLCSVDDERESERERESFLLVNITCSSWQPPKISQNTMVHDSSCPTFI